MSEHRDARWILLAAFVSCAALAHAQEALQEAGVLISDPDSRCEIRLPGAYWDSQRKSDAPEAPAGGCGRPAWPPELLLFATHKDALAAVQVVRGEGSFLMRNKDDMESYVQGAVHGMTQAVGAGGTVLDSSYEESDGMIAHRLEMRAPMRAGGGCGAAAPQGAQMVRYLFVDYFVRPQGEDALKFQLRCFAPDDVFEELKPEIDFIVSSFRFTGEVAEEFFEPDAPEEKVPTAAQAAKTMQGKSRFPWLMVIGLMIIIWLLFRRKKQAAK